MDRFMGFYHVFADGTDEYPPCLCAAFEKFLKYEQEGEQRIRLYHVTEPEQDSLAEKEILLLAKGDMPY